MKTPEPGEDLTLPIVLGNVITRALDDLSREAMICLNREQQRDKPDAQLTAVLCNTVRLIREHLNLLKHMKSEQ